MNTEGPTEFKESDSQEFKDLCKAMGWVDENGKIRANTNRSLKFQWKVHSCSKPLAMVLSGVLMLSLMACFFSLVEVYGWLKTAITVGCVLAWWTHGASDIIRDAIGSVVSFSLACAQALWSENVFSMLLFVSMSAFGFVIGLSCFYNEKVGNETWAQVMGAFFVLFGTIGPLCIGKTFLSRVRARIEKINPHPPHSQPDQTSP